MKEGESFKDMSLEEKRRLAYIEGREDLFETKVFEIEKSKTTKEASKQKKNIVVISRDPGSANALIPVIELLQKKENIRIKAVIDGRAQETFQKKFKTKDITPKGNILESAETLGSPDLGLVDSSEGRGIEMFFSATFPEVPNVLVEDYYGSSLPYLKRLKEASLPYPKKICVIDKEAKNIIVRDFPELSSSIEITGQPAFDVYAKENTEKISKKVRRELGLKSKEKLVTFMSSIDPMELVEKFAEELSKIKNKGLRFTFRTHPRDNTPLENYEKLFTEKGIDYLLTMGKVTTDEVGAASDLVCMVSSTTMFPAIYRGIPVVSITDPKYIEQKEGAIPPPPAKIGAIFNLDSLENLPNCVEILLDKNSEERKELIKKMEENYPIDGKNAERVVSVLEGILND